MPQLRLQRLGRCTLGEQVADYDMRSGNRAHTLIGNHARQRAAVSPMGTLLVALLHVALVDATRIICTLDGGKHDYDAAQLMQHSWTVQRKIQVGGASCIELPVTSFQLRAAIAFADAFPRPDGYQFFGPVYGASSFILKRCAQGYNVLEQLVLAADHLEMRSLMVAIGWAMRRDSEPFFRVLSLNQHRQACRFISGINRLQEVAGNSQPRILLAMQISLLFVVRRPDPALAFLTNTPWNVNGGFVNVLEFAADTGEADIVEVVLNLPAGVDANSQYDPALLETPLLLAVRRGHTAIVRMLLEYRGREAGSPLNHRVNANAMFGPDLQTPLSIAAANGHVEIVQALLQVADINVGKRTCYPNGSRWWTPLHWAASEGHLDVVQVLLTDGRSDINAGDEHRHTPLRLAMLNGHLPVVLLLQSLDAGRLESVP
ncbi:Ankyrin repeat domain-containing protein [Plasmodiophora brassicae]